MSTTDSKEGQSSCWQESSLNWPRLNVTRTLITRLRAFRERVKRWQASVLSRRIKEPFWAFLRTSLACSPERSPQYHPHILNLFSMWWRLIRLEGERCIPPLDITIHPESQQLPTHSFTLERGFYDLLTVSTACGTSVITGQTPLSCKNWYAHIMISPTTGNHS